MAGKGGKRVGAGRKPKRGEDEQGALIRRSLPLDKQESLVSRLYDIAMGDNLKAAVTAATTLLAYAVGKPTEKHEHGGKDGGPIVLKVVYGGRP